jgi:DNA-binding response OmpR family regulator
MIFRRRPLPRSKHKPFAFGDFELDDFARSLRLRGEPLSAQPLVLSLIGYLVRHAGRRAQERTAPSAVARRPRHRGLAAARRQPRAKGTEGGRPRGPKRQ